jgi:hypothetical protein
MGTPGLQAIFFEISTLLGWGKRPILGFSWLGRADCAQKNNGGSLTGFC